VHGGSFACAVVFNGVGKQIFVGFRCSFSGGTLVVVEGCFGEF